MSSPDDDYPNDERMYPIDSPETALSGGLGIHPALDGELSRLAPSRATILLVGGGAALQLAVARALHERSRRAGFPFVVFDCSGLASERVEAELFGGPSYAPGAGGAIQRVDAGTLYVASIDELPLLAQPRFLRFLDEEREARVVSSAARELRARVAGGLFRLDLAERLTLVELWLPEPRRGLP